MQQYIETGANKQLHQLLEICNKLGNAEDLPALLDMVIDGIRKIVGAEYAAILLLDQITGALNVAAASDLPSSSDEKPVVTNTLAKLTVESKQPLMLGDDLAIEDANVVILMLDGSEGITDQDASLIGFVLDVGRALQRRLF